MLELPAFRGHCSERMMVATTHQHLGRPASQHSEQAVRGCPDSVHGAFQPAIGVVLSVRSDW